MEGIDKGKVSFPKKKIIPSVVTFRSGPRLEGIDKVKVSLPKKQIVPSVITFRSGPRFKPLFMAGCDETMSSVLQRGLSLFLEQPAVPQHGCSFMVKFTAMDYDATSFRGSLGQFLQKFDYAMACNRGLRIDIVMGIQANSSKKSPTALRCPESVMQLPMTPSDPSYGAGASSFVPGKNNAEKEPKRNRDGSNNGGGGGGGDDDDDDGDTSGAGGSGRLVQRHKRNAEDDDNFLVYFHYDGSQSQCIFGKSVLMVDLFLRGASEINSGELNEKFRSTSNFSDAVVVTFLKKEGVSEPLINYNKTTLALFLQVFGTDLDDERCLQLYFALPGESHPTQGGRLHPMLEEGAVVANTVATTGKRTVGELAQPLPGEIATDANPIAVSTVSVFCKCTI